MLILLNTLVFQSNILTIDEPDYSGQRLQEQDNLYMQPPARQVYWQIGWQSADATNLAANMIYNVKLKYYVRLSKPSPTYQSL